MNKASGADRVPVDLFQILKDDSVQVLTQYASKFGKLTVATGLEKFSYHSNRKERQCQRMFKLPHNCTHLTHQQSNTQNSPSYASTVCELRTSRCSSWIQKRQRNQRSNYQHPLVVVQSLSRVQLFASPWIIACQAPLSIGFSGQEYWSRWPFPSSGDLSDSGIKPGSPALQADSLKQTNNQKNRSLKPYDYS